MTKVTHPLPLVRETLDIITPTYNPKPGWEKQYVEQASEVAEAFSEADVHFIVVNDGSYTINDLQISYIKKSLKRFSYVELKVNSGKGAAIRAGLSECHSKYIMYTDIDFPYTTESMRAVFLQIKAGKDIACGSRSESYYKQVPLQRRIVSLVLKWLNRVILKLPVVDTQVGLKAMNLKGKEVLNKTKINHFLFDVEFILNSTKIKDLKIVAEPVSLRSTTRVPRLHLKIIFREFKNFVSLLARILRPF